MIINDSPTIANVDAKNKAEEIDANNITNLLLTFKRRHRNVFIEQVGEFVFIYRSLNRKEYKMIFEDPNSNEFEKEDIICNTCLLWPEEFNFDEADAGIPTNLCKAVLSNSFLSEEDDKYKLLDYYRSDMHSINNQINCIINEAFPNEDIEDIEEWDLEKTMKYLSRAEWILYNLRGLEFVESNAIDSRTQQQEAQESTQIDTHQEAQAQNTQQDNNSELTPQKLAELKQKFPEIDWENDIVAAEGEKAFDAHYDTIAPALRTGA